MTKENKVGCLILHGFAGSRQDIAPLTNGLIQNGYEVSAPLLAGHEAGRKSLSNIKYTDWIRSAEDALFQMENRCEKVIVIGFSMGGLIGAQLYRRHDLSALVLINTPVYYWNVKQILLNLFSGSRYYFQKYLNAGTSVPIHALWEFVTLLNKTKPIFTDIVDESLIIQTLDDDTVNPKSLWFLCKNVRGPKYIITYPRGGHMVFQTQTGANICATVCDFLRRVSIKAIPVTG